MRRDFIYIAFCLILPAVWGIVSALVFDRCQTWLARRRDSRSSGTVVPSAEEASPDMYHI
jgi:predicted PurR-regulated permease PerM